MYDPRYTSARQARTASALTTRCEADVLTPPISCSWCAARASCMYRHPLPHPLPPSLPWNVTCSSPMAPPPPTHVPPSTYSDYSCIGPSPFLSPSTPQRLKKGFNRQRMCMLRNVCVVDRDADAPAARHEDEYHTAFALKSISMYRPHRLISAYGEFLGHSTLEQQLQQPALYRDAQGEGLVHLHAWENHNGGQPSWLQDVLGASPSVTYSQSPPPPTQPSKASLCSIARCLLPLTLRRWYRPSAAALRMGRRRRRRRRARARAHAALRPQELWPSHSR